MVAAVTRARWSVRSTAPPAPHSRSRGGRCDSSGSPTGTAGRAVGGDRGAAGDHGRPYRRYRGPGRSVVRSGPPYRRQSGAGRPRGSGPGLGRSRRAHPRRPTGSEASCVTSVTGSSPIRPGRRTPTSCGTRTSPTAPRLAGGSAGDRDPAPRLHHLRGAGSGSGHGGGPGGRASPGVAHRSRGSGKDALGHRGGPGDGPGLSRGVVVLRPVGGHQRGRGHRTPGHLPRISGRTPDELVTAVTDWLMVTPLCKSSTIANRWRARWPL